MRLRWLALFPIALGFTYCSKAEKAGNAVGTPGFCDPGSEIFCRCKGGAPGTKTCNADGSLFTECHQADGTCPDVPEDTVDAGAGVGGASGSGETGAGGAPPKCAHDSCTQGFALDPSCDACAAKLCTGAMPIDAYCCNLDPANPGGVWDKVCVDEAQQHCGVKCMMGTTASSSSSSSSSTGGGGDCYKLAELIAGDLVITEAMNKPQAQPESQGEWFEIYNASEPPKCIDLNGVRIDSKNDTGTTIQTSIIVPVSGYAVLGRGDAATMANYGIKIVYSYGANIALNNTADSITLKAGTKVIDTINYDNAKLLAVGATRSLDPKFLSNTSNDDDAHFCLAKSFIMGSSGDRGTPGKANDSCP
jgi:hypothetical protein